MCERRGVDPERRRGAAVVVGEVEPSGAGGRPPVLLFVGALDYGPNTEAMSGFPPGSVADRRGGPAPTCRCTWWDGAPLGSLAEGPGIELLGSVPDIQAELDRADVSIVPIQRRGRPRLKVIEALANHLPMVTTSVGCEGIDVADGRTALISDGAAGFAGAVLRLVADGALRSRLAGAGRELFEERYTWSGIRDRVAALARSTAR